MIKAMVRVVSEANRLLLLNITASFCLYWLMSYMHGIF